MKKREGLLAGPSRVPTHRLLPQAGFDRLSRQQDLAICRDFTGATGLEPATSGVTGMFQGSDD
jgi:hypothetical protein